jgi:hypothetical protein
MAISAANASARKIDFLLFLQLFILDPPLDFLHGRSNKMLFLANLSFRDAFFQIQA